MNGILYTLAAWKEMAVIIGCVLLLVLFITYAWRRFSYTSPFSIIGTLGILFIGILTYYFYFKEGEFAWSEHTREMFFVMLYMWCALGTLFIAMRSTHVFKLFMGLASQAGIVYLLYTLV